MGRELSPWSKLSGGRGEDAQVVSGEHGDARAMVQRVEPNEKRKTLKDTEREPNQCLSSRMKTLEQN